LRRSNRMVEGGDAGKSSCLSGFLRAFGFGKPGAGVCPVRGHSNVQGDRTMGIWERPTPAFVAALEKATGITAPRAHGFDTVNSIV